MLNKYTKRKSTADQIFGKLPMWKVMLHVTAPAFLVGFMTALFTFIDMILLVNLMPLTERFDYANTFINTGMFQTLVNHIQTSNNHLQELLKNNQNYEALIKYFSFKNGLHFYTVAGTIRVASSLISPLTFLMTSITGLIMPGANVLMSRSISVKNQLEQVKIWQNEFYLAIIVTALGMILIYILNYTIIPLMVNSSVNTYIQSSLIHPQTYYFTIQNNKLIFLERTSNNQYINALNVTSNTIYTQNIDSFTLSNNQNEYSYLIRTTFLDYYDHVKNYSISWAQDFVTIYTSGLLIACWQRLNVNVIRNYGKTLVSTLTLVLSTCFNILFDFVFIYYAQIGMDGAAVASLISWTFAAILLSVYLQLLHKKGMIFISYNHLLFSKFMYTNKIVKQILYISVSFLVSFLSYMIVRILLIHQITYVTGQLYSALGSLYFISITGAVYPVMNLFQNTISSMTNAGTSIVAYNYGIKNYKRIRGFIYENTIFIISLGLILLGLFGFCSPISDWMLGLFHIQVVYGHNSLAYLYQCARKFLWISLMILPFQGVGNSAFMLFRTAKRYIAATFVGLFRALLVIVPYLYIFSAVALNHMFITPSEAIVNPYYNPNIWILMWTQSAATITTNCITFIWILVYLYKGIYNKKTPIQEWKITKYIAKKSLQYRLNEANVKVGKKYE